MRGLKSTLALLIVLVGLGAYIYFVASKPKEDTASKQEKVFASFATDKVSELKVKAASGDVTSLKKDGETWKIVSPITEKAADSEVSGLTSALEQVDIARVVDENPASLKEFGLDSPQVEVEFKSSDGKSNGRLLLGEKNATGGNVYARRNDEKRVFLIPAYHQASLNKSTFDLRDKTLMTFARDKVDGVEVATGSDTVVIAKAGNGWKLTRPLSAAADESIVDSIISRLESAQMKSIVGEATPADLKKDGFDKPAVTATLNLGSAKATLVIGGKSGDDAFYARDSSKSTIVTVEKALVDDLTKKVDDYRRKDVFEGRAFTINHVELAGGGKTLAFDRVKGKDDTSPDTFRKTGTTTDLDKDKVQNLLTGLADIRATSFTSSRAGTGLDSPVLTVTFKFDDNKKEEKVVFGKGGKDAYASTSDPGAAKIDADKLDEALKTFQELTK